MKRPSSTPIRRVAHGLVATALSVTALAAAATIVRAQEHEEQSLGELQTEEAASMRESTYKELAKAQDKAEASDYPAAIRVLDKLKEEELNSYELAQVWNLYAYIYYSQDDYAKAIGAYENLLSQPDVPEALETSTVYTLAQLYFTSEQWQEAIDQLDRWIALGQDPKPQTYELISQAYYQLEQYRNALSPAMKAIELTQKEGQTVKENSYLLLRVLHYELGEHDKVASVLHELIKRYPKKQYWMQLVSVYGELSDQRKQLNTLELAYLQGYLKKENEVITLASMLLQDDLPYKAGKVLEKGLDDGVVTPTYERWRLLAQAWMLAQENEKAIPALIRAAGLSEDGKLDLTLAQVYMNLERWEEAARAAREGIGKGGLDRPDQAQIVLGQVLFNMKAFDEARQAFQAAQLDHRSRKIAAQWLAYIDNEERRRAQLGQALE
jgi:tetratricopeptide (TPR) repeat protein